MWGGAVCPSLASGFTAGFWWGPSCSSLWVSVLCGFIVCLRSVSSVPGVAGFSELSILDCPFGFL